MYKADFYKSVPKTCPSGRDSLWDIEWPETGSNVTVQGECPHQLGPDISGNCMLIMSLCTDNKMNRKNNSLLQQ